MEVSVSGLGALVTTNRVIIELITNLGRRCDFEPISVEGVMTVGRWAINQAWPGMDVMAR